jgi:NADH-quinone oxidoreductase subunit J
MVEAVFLLFQRAQMMVDLSQPDAQINTMESIRSLAMMLFNQYLLPFEITSVLLLVAMVGAIVLTKQEKGAAG